jgi:hypothetical protein
MRLQPLDRRLRGFWPELIIGTCWLTLLLSGQLLFRDDESVAHRATHLGLWLTLAAYVAIAVRGYRRGDA